MTYLKGTLRIWSGTPFSPAFFVRITPYENVLKNFGKRCSCVREFGRETTSFMFGARLMNANLEFHRKNIGKNHQTAGHHIEVEWNWWTRSIIMYCTSNSRASSTSIHVFFMMNGWNGWIWHTFVHGGYVNIT